MLDDQGPRSRETVVLAVTVAVRLDVGDITQFSLVRFRIRFFLDLRRDKICDPYSILDYKIEDRIFPRLTPVAYPLLGSANDIHLMLITNDIIKYL